MGLFSSKNNTISDEKMASLRRRAARGKPAFDTSKEASDRRKAASLQYAKRTQS